MNLEDVWQRVIELMIPELESHNLFVDINKIKRPTLQWIPNSSQIEHKPMIIQIWENSNATVLIAEDTYSGQDAPYQLAHEHAHYLYHMAGGRRFAEEWAQWAEVALRNTE